MRWVTQGLGLRISRQDAALALVVSALVGLLVVPVSTVVLDVLLSLQLAVSLVVLAVAVSARRPLALTAFPAVLVVLTLSRLTLNVSTTRAILADADAGRLVAAFGEVMIAGSATVGLIVFGVLSVMQYLVVSRGAERVAQVSARFALDALPGRQLAIDGEVRSGGLDAEGARTRRLSLSREAGLAGALDGTMKMVKGESIAALCIIAVNLIGGIAVGTLEQGLPLAEAARSYPLLTIGDGLLQQLPSVLTTLAAAVLVTRIASPSPGQSLWESVSEQFGNERSAAVVGALACLLLAVLPGLPFWPLLLAALVMVLASGLRGPDPSGSGDAEPLGETFRVGLSVEAERAIGGSETVTADARSVRAVRHRLRRSDDVDSGPIGVERGVTDVPPGGFRISVNGVVVARGSLYEGRRFVTPGPLGSDAVCAHPRTGVPGAWFDGLGQSPEAYFEEHVLQVVRRNIGAVLGVQAVAERVALLEIEHPALVRAVVPRCLDLPRLTRLHHRLVEDGLSVRNTRTIFEALAQTPTDATSDDAVLTQLRRRLAAQVSALVAPTGRASVLCLSTAIEEQVRRGATLSPEHLEELMTELGAASAHHPDAALLVSPDLRLAIAALVRPHFHGLPIIAADELLPEIRLTPVAIVGAV